MIASVAPTAVILCGGRTSRFGGEKARASVGGRAVIDRVVGVVGPLSGEVIAVTSAGKAGLRLPDEVAVVTDLYPGSGPLGGICTGLRHARSDLALVVGCDMPFLNREFLRLILDSAAGFDAVAPRLADGYVQPLHAVYARACLAKLEGGLARGQLSVWRVLGELHTRYVEEAEYLPLDPGMLSFFNLNTPEDLERADRLAAVQDPRRPDRPQGASGLETGP